MFFIYQEKHTNENFKVKKGSSQKRTNRKELSQLEKKDVN